MGLLNRGGLHKRIPISQAIIIHHLTALAQQVRTAGQDVQEDHNVSVAGSRKSVAPRLGSHMERRRAALEPSAKWPLLGPDFAPVGV
jgi:hypothetical protein